jgi:hypothetical protein
MRTKIAITFPIFLFRRLHVCRIARNVLLDHFYVLDAIFGKIMMAKASKKNTPP